MAKKRKMLLHKQKSKQSKQSVKNKGTNNNNPKAGKADTAPNGPKNTHPRDLEPTKPFSPGDAILLVGEGDLSFSRALVEHHGCENITATVLDSDLDELSAKYPQVQDNIDVIEAEGGKVLYGVDAKRMGPWAKKSGKESVGIYDRISTHLRLLPCVVRPEVEDDWLTMSSQSIQLPTCRWQEYRCKSSGALQPGTPRRVL